MAGVQGCREGLVRACTPGETAFPIGFLWGGGRRESEMLSAEAWGRPRMRGTGRGCHLQGQVDCMSPA